MPADGVLAPRDDTCVLGLSGCLGSFLIGVGAVPRKEALEKSGRPLTKLIECRRLRGRPLRGGHKDLHWLLDLVLSKTLKR